MSVDPKKFGITPSLVDAVKLTLEGKSLAALAPPRDKVTHKDVLVGRGVLKKHPQDPDKHVVAKEEAEQIDEVGDTPAGKKALIRYVKKAGGTSLDSAAALALDGNRKKAKIRAKSVERAADRLAKEEVEQIDEIGDTPAGRKALGSYVKKASARAADKSRHAGDIENRRDISPAAKEVLAKHNRKIDNSSKGISRATDRLTKEEVEQVDEISSDLAQRYRTKALAHTSKVSPDVPSQSPEGQAARRQDRNRSQGKQLSWMKMTGQGMGGKALKVPATRPKPTNVSEADGSSNPSTNSSALTRINTIATDMKKMASEPLKPPKDPGAVKKLPNVNAPGAPDMFKTEAVADPMAAKKAEVQKKIAQKQATAVQARANKRMSNINASNDKCSCDSTNESKMKCEVHGDSGMKGGKEKIEVNPPLREAEDLPKKVITKGHEIAKSLIKNRAKVREPYAVGMAQAKKSAGIKN